MRLFPAQPPPNICALIARFILTQIRERGDAAFLIAGRYLNNAVLQLQRSCKPLSDYDRTALIPAAYNISVVSLCRHAAIRPTPSVSNEQRFWKPLAGAALVPNHLPLLTEGRGASLGYRGHKDEQTFGSRAGCDLSGSIDHLRR